jgi:hypothetical protein
MRMCFGDIEIMIKQTRSFKFGNLIGSLFKIKKTKKKHLLDPSDLSKIWARCVSV